MTCTASHVEKVMYGTHCRVHILPCSLQTEPRHQSASPTNPRCLTAAAETTTTTTDAGVADSAATDVCSRERSRGRLELPALCVRPYTRLLRHISAASAATSCWSFSASALLLLQASVPELLGCPPQDRQRKGPGTMQQRPPASHLGL